jgi:tetratricopeptide (TPR) repeat protein
MATRNYRAAVPLFSKLAGSSSPRKWNAYVRIGEALSKQGELKQANDAFLEVLKRYPAHCGALIGYAALHRSRREQGAAEDALCAMYKPITQLVDSVVSSDVVFTLVALLLFLRCYAVLICCTPCHASRCMRCVHMPCYW